MDCPKRLERLTPLSGAKKLAFALLLFAPCCYSQTVSPVIVEYKVKAEGRIALTNNTLTQMAVVVEPRSFSIAPDGNGRYRPLDPGIHVQLSSMSFRIDPGQTYYIFYKAKADKLPAWFTLYSTFSSVQHTSGLDIRILLPHTVYIYPKRPLGQGNTVQVTHVSYSPVAKRIVCDLENNSSDLDRVQEVEIISGGKSISAPGFPMLPGGRRRLEFAWNESGPPETIQFRLQHSRLKLPIALEDQKSLSTPGTTQ